MALVRSAPVHTAAHLTPGRKRTDPAPALIVAHADTPSFILSPCGALRAVGFLRRGERGWL